MSKEVVPDSIAIVCYRDEYANSFAGLNREWLEGYSLFEDADRKYLEHPRQSILDPGGEIFFAVRRGEAVGTCAAIVREAETVELAKLAVASGVRGRGIGRQLSEAAIAWARGRGARRVVLVSSTKLTAALRLYERLGFEYCALPADPGYETADIYMELAL